MQSLQSPDRYRAQPAATWQLLADLRSQGLRFLKGYSKHPTGGWPAEESVLVLGVDLRAATAIANRFERDAFLWISATAISELILLR